MVGTGSESLVISIVLKGKQIFPRDHLQPRMAGYFLKISKYITETNDSNNNF